MIDLRACAKRPNQIYLSKPVASLWAILLEIPWLCPNTTTQTPVSKCRQSSHTIYPQSSHVASCVFFPSTDPVYRHHLGCNCLNVETCLPFRWIKQTSPRLCPVLRRDLRFGSAKTIPPLFRRSRFNCILRLQSKASDHSHILNQKALYLPLLHEDMAVSVTISIKRLKNDGSKQPWRRSFLSDQGLPQVRLPFWLFSCEDSKGEINSSDRTLNYTGRRRIIRSAKLNAAVRSRNTKSWFCWWYVYSLASVEQKHRYSPERLGIHPDF